MRVQPRAGFTLVELMVAMALTMFIMVILSQAFVIALDTFVGLKAIGDMQGNLRTAKVILTSDLAEDHFEAARRLSDLTKNGRARIATQKPRAGFFAVLQGSLVTNATAGNALTGPYVCEGVDANLSAAFPGGFPSFRATNHVLYMTVKRKGNRAENYFTAALRMPAASAFFANSSSYTMNSFTDIPPATFGDDPTLSAPVCNFNSQWAEVIYYLVQTGSTEEPNNPNSTIGIPLFSLMRAQFVMVTDGTNITGIPGGAELTFLRGVSCNTIVPGSCAVFSPADAAQKPGFRVVQTLASLVDTSPTGGNALVKPFPIRIANVATPVLPNVTSFHIQVMPLVASGNATFTDVVGPLNVTSGGMGIYDTTALTTNNLGLKGIQITVRVFEPKTRQTRQMTIVQSL